jgi:curved DNA-binding protein CbpA
MGSDYFAVLRQPRRPWLDLDQLRDEYQQLTFARHPDKSEEPEPGAKFAEIIEAYRVLSNPKLRLQHLLSLETATANQTSEVPAEIADVFMDTAALVSEIDRLLHRRDAATSALAKSMLEAEKATLQRRAGAALHDLHRLYADALGELQRLDLRWLDDKTTIAAGLENLAQRFGYLDRWIGQLTEKQYQLST